MYKIKYLALTAFLALRLSGCPDNKQTQNVANAALTASSTLQAAQQAEITLYNQGLICTGQPSCVVISVEDHKFIQQQFLTVASIGKTLDSCIRTAGNTAGDLACVNTATQNVSTIYTNSGAFIKSPEARRDFQAALAAVNLALNVLSKVLGGN